MKIGLLICGLLAVSTSRAADAQSLNDDVRCMLVSSGFARMAKDDNSRRASAMTGAFYLGRINQQAQGPKLSAAIRAQGNGIPAKEAETVMRACAARATAAQDQMTAAVKQAQSGK